MNKIIEFPYTVSRKYPGKYITEGSCAKWEQGDNYYIKGSAIGVENPNNRLKIIAPNETEYIYNTYGIDKISLIFRRSFINEEKYFYKTDLLTYNHCSSYTKIHFHAECFRFDEDFKTIKDNLVFYLKQLVDIGFFKIPTTYYNERTDKEYTNETYNWYENKPSSKSEILQIILEHFKLSELEIYFDFDEILRKYLKLEDYIDYCGTLYSKDYRNRDNYKLKSVVSIYNRGKKLGLNEDRYRIEYRLTGRYLRKSAIDNGKRKSVHRFNIDSFDLSIDEFLISIEKHLGVISNKNLKYNYALSLTLDETFILHRIFRNYRHLKRYRMNRKKSSSNNN